MTKHNLENSVGIEEGRRRFLIASGLGAAGLSLYSFKAAGISLAQARRLTLNDSALKFADSVGADILGVIVNYLRSLSREAIAEVKNTNYEMERLEGGPFKCPDSTRVSGVREMSYFFYTAQGGDGINACTAFFDGRRPLGKQRVALIAGPALFGIGELAQKIARERSTEVARRLLLPRESVNRAPAYLDRKYETPDVFRTDEGTVITNFEIGGPDRGVVIVKVLGVKGDTIINDEKFKLPF